MKNNGPLQTEFLGRTRHAAAFPLLASTHGSGVYSMTAISPYSTACHAFQKKVLLFSRLKTHSMFGPLQHDQIEEVLQTQVVGRIGCSADGETYVVPISYAYDGNFIYCHSYEGKKMAIMRKNPKVCFQVDNMRDMANWKSVIVQGNFEELLNQDEKAEAMHALLHRYLPLVSSVTTHLGKNWPFEPDDISEINGVVFRIAVIEKTGRFETSSQSPDLPG